MYSDLDYEVFANLFENLPSDAPDAIMIVRSPVLLQEVFQNSLMVSNSPGHDFWYECVKTIDSIFHFIHSPTECQHWGGCDHIRLFHNFFTKRGTHTTMTVYMTDPAVLDKTWVIHQDRKWRIIPLPSDKFFVGETACAVHHHVNSWVDLPSAFREVYIFGTLGLILFLVVVGFIVSMFYKASCKARIRALKTQYFSHGDYDPAQRVKG